MKNKLFDFQEEALVQLRSKLSIARLSASTNEPQAISFSAPTGAGKTIVMTALFENIFHGHSELGSQEAPVILWISDMPELNEQTRRKIESKSESIQVRQLETIDSNFDQEFLSGNKIYFINVQKLGSDKKLTRKGDARHYTIWETLSNTAQKFPEKFYVVIDEAHRGMQKKGERKTAQSIIQKFLIGSAEDNLCKMPLVIGVSATPKRFVNLLSGTEHTISKVTVDSTDVRDSGLLKDRILIHYPEIATEADMTLLSEATKRWVSLDTRWSSYCLSENEDAVKPILVIQVEDGVRGGLTKTDLGTVLKTVEKAAGRKLAEGEIAHNFFDKVSEIKIGDYLVKHVDASRIEESSQIGVVLFKMSLSTGWDCPRSEVMMSFRQAKDHTYIAQLLGRMVRAPLARRIAADAGLNDVHLYLPRYDTTTVSTVIQDLNDTENVPPSDVGSARQMVELLRKPGMEDLFEQMSLIPIYRVASVRKQSSLRRLFKLAWLLTNHGLDENLHQEIVGKILEKINQEMEGLRSSVDLKLKIHEIMNVEMSATKVKVQDQRPNQGKEEYTVTIHPDDIDRIFEKTDRILGNGLHTSYWKKCSDANPEKSHDEIKLEIAVLAHDRERMFNLEAFAEKEFDALYDKHKGEIRKLNEREYSEIEKLRLASADHKHSEWRLPEVIGFNRTEQAPEYDKHLFLEKDGSFRCDLGTWEKEVLQEEMKDQTVIGWVRNLDRKPWSLSISYEYAGKITPMFPDLLIARKRGKDYAFDILEPHNPSLKDNVAKAKGLAKFADKHSDSFGRIELIRKEPQGKILRLDINKQAIRRKILSLLDNDQNRLDEIFNEEARVRKARI